MTYVQRATSMLLPTWLSLVQLDDLCITPWFPTCNDSFAVAASGRGVRNQGKGKSPLEAGLHFSCSTWHHQIAEHATHASCSDSGWPTVRTYSRASPLCHTKLAQAAVVTTPSPAGSTHTQHVTDPLPET